MESPQVPRRRGHHPGQHGHAGPRDPPRTPDLSRPDPDLPGLAGRAGQPVAARHLQGRPDQRHPPDASKCSTRHRATRRSRTCSSHVQETQTGSFLLGVGINSDAGRDRQHRAQRAELRHPPLPDELGRRHRRPGVPRRRAGVPARGGAGQPVFQRYTASLREPYLFDSLYGLSVSGYYYNRGFVEYNEDRVGGRVTVGRRLDQFWSANVSDPGRGRDGQGRAVRRTRRRSPTTAGTASWSASGPGSGATAATPTCGRRRQRVRRRLRAGVRRLHVPARHGRVHELLDHLQPAGRQRQARAGVPQPGVVGPGTTRRCSSGSTPAVSAASAGSSSAASARS